LSACIAPGDIGFTVDDEASELGVRVAYNVYRGPKIGGLRREILDDKLREVLGEVSRRYSLEGLKNHPVARAYRDFYWRVGVDPTKTRPSGEALVRRALRGRFPRVNPIVDAGNMASALTLVPIGLYDLEKASPPFRLTLSRGGEEFHPLGGKPRRLEPGLPILVDSRGTVMHLYPHRDSVHTALSESTRVVLAVAAGVPGVPGKLLVEALRLLEEFLSPLSWRPCGSPLLAP